MNRRTARITENTPASVLLLLFQVFHAIVEFWATLSEITWFWFILWVKAAQSKRDESPSLCERHRELRPNAIASDKFQACGLSSIELPMKYGFRGLLLQWLPRRATSRNHKCTLKSPAEVKQSIPCRDWFIGSLCGLVCGFLLMGLLRHRCSKADGWTCQALKDKAVNFR